MLLQHEVTLFNFKLLLVMNENAIFKIFLVFTISQLRILNFFKFKILTCISHQVGLIALEMSNLVCPLHECIYVITRVLIHIDQNIGHLPLECVT